MPYDWLGYYDENHYTDLLHRAAREERRRAAGEPDRVVEREALAAERLGGRAAYAAADAASEIPLD